MKIRRIPRTDHQLTGTRIHTVLLLIVTGIVGVLLVTGCNGEAVQRPVMEAHAVESTTTPDPLDRSEQPIQTVYPKRLEGYVPNPAMGWQDTEVSNTRFPETVGYVRDNWPTFQPEEGVYDWSVIEKLRDRMVAEGGKISFRIQTAKPPPWGQGHGVPDWLVRRGAQTVMGELGSEPLYTSCLFLEFHGKFIDVLRQRYDGDADVAFIDIGSYGLYGEWHTTQYSWDMGTLDWHARRWIIDMYLGGEGTRPCVDKDGKTVQRSYVYEGFHHTQLIMPYTPGFSDSLRYALSHRNDIGIRHDALGSEEHQDFYEQEISQLVEQTWRRAPIIFEFASEAHTPDRLRSARAFAEDMHASFIHENFNGHGSNELIERILERTGYRLVLHEANYMAKLRPGEALTVDLLWENEGIAPPYVSYPLLVQLIDSAGQVVAEQQVNNDMRSWLPNTSIPLQIAVPLSQTLAVGEYTLQLAFVDADTKQPALTLAIEGKNDKGYYTLGPVSVLP